MEVSKLLRVSLIEHFGFVEFRVGKLGCIGSDTADAQDPIATLLEHTAKMIWMGAVDHVVGRTVPGNRVDLVDSLSQSLTRRQTSIGFNCK